MAWAREGVEHVYRSALDAAPRTPYGELAGAVLLLEDVTRLHQIDRLKSEFIAAASHELRTPLGSLQLGLQPGARGIRARSSPRQREILGLCRDDADRLARMTRDLLDLSRLESGEHTHRLRAVEPTSGLIRGAVAPLRLTAGRPAR